VTELYNLPIFFIENKDLEAMYATEAIKASKLLAS